MRMLYTARCFVVVGITLFLFLVPSSLSAARLSSSPARVLFISSYDPNFPTFFRQVNGLKSVFDQLDVDLDIEFMDSKRFYDQASIELFHQNLSHKLARLPPYDLIMTADDNALHYALEEQDRLLGGRPIIFFGVNNLELARAQDDNPRVTGVVEAVSMRATLELIRRLQPQVGQIVALVDGTPSGQADLETFYNAGKLLPGVELRELSLDRLRIEELLARLRTLPETSAVLLLSAYRDKAGRSFHFEESLALIRANLERPLYHLWYHGMGEGIVGGMLIDHYQQAVAAARIAERVINGEGFAQLRVVTTSPNRYVFDARELKRFGLKMGELEEGAIVLNRPASFYRDHKALFIVFHLVFFVLLSFVLLLIRNIVRRRRAERDLQYHLGDLEEQVAERTQELEEKNYALQQSEARYRSLSDASFEGISFSEKGVVLEANRTLAEMFGYSVDELIGRRVEEFVVPEARIEVEERIRSEDEIPCEVLGVRRNGDILPILIQAKTFQDGAHRVRVTAIRDLSAEKRAEEEIQALRGILPICASCKKIRDDSGYWKRIEEYFEKRSDLLFSHGLCLECEEELYGKEEWYRKWRDKQG